MPPAAAADDVVGRAPVELLDDLEGRRLGALGVERAQGDVGEVHARRFGDLAAAPVGFVVVALDLADLGAQGHAAARLGGLEAVRVEDVGVDARLRRQRGDGGADVARRDAADLGLAPLEQPGDRHRDDPVLVGEARSRGGVVLQVEVGDAQLGAQAVGPDQGRVARVVSHARLRARVDDRQQLLEVPDVLRALLARHLGEVAGGQLVVVDDVQALAAVRAGEDRVAPAASCSRSDGRPDPVAHERVRCLGVGGPPQGSVRSVCSCGHLERYAGPRRLCAVLLVAERQPQLLGEVRDERAEHLRPAPKARRAAHRGSPGSGRARARAPVSRSP